MMSNADRPRVALVTGASSGIGRDIAQVLLGDGMVVYCVARRLSRMDDLRTAGAFPLAMDLADPDQIQNVVDQIERDHGGVDVLVNNAACGLYGSVEETSLEEVRYQFDVNMFGTARLTQLVLPYMREQKDGRIINITSIGGKIYTPLGAWYHATKHALEGWSDSLRLELHPFNVKVVVIQPGMIESEFGRAMENSMLEHSGSGPYAKMAQAMAATMRRNDDRGSSPRVISEIVQKAIYSKNPKPRYAGGKTAKPLLFLRKWLGDRVFDKIILSQTDG
jgi:short-subunit dehydrogenase